MPENLSIKPNWRKAMLDFFDQKGIPPDDPRVERVESEMASLENSNPAVEDFLSALCINACRGVVYSSEREH